jgi:hypothetical protein
MKSRVTLKCLKKERKRKTKSKGKYLEHSNFCQRLFVFALCSNCCIWLIGFVLFVVYFLLLLVKKENRKRKKEKRKRKNVTTPH